MDQRWTPNPIKALEHAVKIRQAFDSDECGRFGFKPAGDLGFDATYPIAEKNADAWMVSALRPGVVGTVVSGKVLCAESLDKPEYWTE